MRAGRKDVRGGGKDRKWREREREREREYVRINKNKHHKTSWYTYTTCRRTG